MKITVIGLGYVGAVAAAGLADTGHDVLGVDIDRIRVNSLSSGNVPIYEPGLESGIGVGLAHGNLRFSHPDDICEPLGDIALIATGTPPRQSGAADLSQVRSALDWIKSKPHDNLLVVMKSTVPPGTGCRLLSEDLGGSRIRYASNPEFLREGHAVADWDSPDRIVIGAEPGDQKTIEVVKKMHSGISAPFVITDITSAEMTKYASNAFLATRISFINEIAALCDRVGASIDAVSEGLAMDPRTGSRIYAGVGLRRLLLSQRRARLGLPRAHQRRELRAAPICHQCQQQTASLASLRSQKPVRRRNLGTQGRRPRTRVQAGDRRRSRRSLSRPHSRAH